LACTFNFRLITPSFFAKNVLICFCTWFTLNHGIPFFLSSIFSLENFKDSLYHAVIASTLSFVNSSILSEFLRILLPGGVLKLSVYIRSPSSNSTHIPSAYIVTSNLTLAGFSDIETSIEACNDSDNAFIVEHLMKVETPSTNSSYSIGHFVARKPEYSVGSNSALPLASKLKTKRPGIGKTIKNSIFIILYINYVSEYLI